MLTKTYKASVKILGTDLTKYMKQTSFTLPKTSRDCLPMSENEGGAILDVLKG